MNTNTEFKPINADGFWHRPSAQSGFTGYMDLPEQPQPKETFTPSNKPEPQGTWWHQESKDRGFEGYA